MLKKSRVLQEVFHEIKDDVIYGTGSLLKATKSLSARSLFKQQQRDEELQQHDGEQENKQGEIINGDE